MITTLSNPTLLGFIIYLFIVLIVGIISLRYTKSITDFVLAGRKLGTWVVTFSERASGESAWLVLGLPGAAFALGLVKFWTAFGCVAGIIASWWVIAWRLRTETEKYKAITLTEYFVNRFGDSSGTLKFLSSLIIVFFFTFYVAAQFSGAGKVLHVTFGIPQIWGMIIGAIIIVLYTILGGFYAVAWTDVIQSFIMISTLVILPIVAISELGGFGSMIEQIKTNSDLLDLFQGKHGLSALALAIGGLSWGLGYLGQPHLLVRYMSINSADGLNKGKWIAASWAIPAFTGATLMGLAGFALYGNIFDDPEKLMPHMATHLLPPWIAGILISGAIAAMMSTADSQLLVTSSTLTEDIFKQYIDKNNQKKTLLRLGRLVTLFVGIIAFVLAFKSKDLVFTMVSFAWSGLGASFGPALLLTLYWKGIKRQGIIAGMITGSLVTVIWAKVPYLTEIITERFVSFVFSFVSVVVFSLLFSKRKGVRSQVD